jgi:hypothetical protein
LLDEPHARVALLFTGLGRELNDQASLLLDAAFVPGRLIGRPDRMTGRPERPAPIAFG